LSSDLFHSVSSCSTNTMRCLESISARFLRVRVYLVGYIFCIINCHICWDIFGRIDIIYCSLLYVFRGVLSLKTFVLYIYRLRGTMQYTTNNICNLFLQHGNQSLVFFRSSKSSAAFDRAAPGEIDLDSTGGRTPVSPRILLIQRHSSLSRRHAAADWKFPPAGGEDSSSSARSA
jgi:hypothetical protein